MQLSSTSLRTCSAPSYWVRAACCALAGCSVSGSQASAVLGGSGRGACMPACQSCKSRSSVWRASICGMGVISSTLSRPTSTPVACTPQAAPARLRSQAPSNCAGRGLGLAVFSHSWPGSRASQARGAAPSVSGGPWRSPSTQSSSTTSPICRRSGWRCALCGKRACASCQACSVAATLPCNFCCSRSPKPRKGKAPARRSWPSARCTWSAAAAALGAAVALCSRSCTTLYWSKPPMAKRSSSSASASSSPKDTSRRCRKKALAGLRKNWVSCCSVSGTLGLGTNAGRPCSDGAAAALLWCMARHSRA